MTAPGTPHEARHAPNTPDRDHHDPKCPRCGVIWHQAGNRTGHCSACHRTFDSIGAFERHRRDDTCIDPTHTAHAVTGKPYFESRIGDGPHDAGTVYWRLALTDEQADRFERLSRLKQATP